MKLTLYHGSPYEEVTPTYGKGDDRHDYGRGFYLTEDIDLAREWSVCRPDYNYGWVHKYALDLNEIKILDFQKYGTLAWMAEIMKHRDASESRRYKVLSSKFIEKYGIDTTSYDVIKGWRANASYFYIAREFVRDNVDIEILEELLALGGLGIQYCLKSRKAYESLHEVYDGMIKVEYDIYNAKYNERDITARQKMRELIDSDRNKVSHVFSTLF